MIVVKVGGSLFDHPKLGSGLRAFLKSLTPSRVLLVPGGGSVAEAVRDLDRIYALGEYASHWLALRAMDVMGGVLHALVNDPSITVLDSFAFARDDGLRPGSLPHSWDVTSDSIAARAAMVFGAARLLLLKSVDVPKGTTWEEAAQRGWVDAHFPCVMEGVTFVVEIVNFRQVLESVSQ
jgi:5-(aminomethyl)-3-furanmethanol phosphate kinase